MDTLKFDLFDKSVNERFYFQNISAIDFLPTEKRSHYVKGV